MVVAIARRKPCSRRDVSEMFPHWRCSAFIVVASESEAIHSAAKQEWIAPAFAQELRRAQSPLALPCANASRLSQAMTASLTTVFEEVANVSQTLRTRRHRRIPPVQPVLLADADGAGA